jgi:hypothetical protein
MIRFVTIGKKLQNITHHSFGLIPAASGTFPHNNAPRKWRRLPPRTMGIEVQIESCLLNPFNFSTAGQKTYPELARKQTSSFSFNPIFQPGRQCTRSSRVILGVYIPHHRAQALRASVNNVVTFLYYSHGFRTTNNFNNSRVEHSSTRSRCFLTTVT